MASISDAQAAFDAYHAAVSARLAELAGQAQAAAREDASSLVDAINAAKDEIAPVASVTSISGDAEGAQEDQAETPAEESAELVNDPTQDSAR